MRTVRVIDSHTEGEPTRVVLSGGPRLGRGPLRERRERFRRFHDRFRRAVVAEPRGSEPLVGALLVAPERRDEVAGTIFFNGVGYLGMCGHGTMGLVVSLAHLGRIGRGSHVIGTPVGPVHATLGPGGRVVVENVPSYRARSGVALALPGGSTVVGDIAWGGNWFFLVESEDPPVRRENVPALSERAHAIRSALARAGITGVGGAPIDHVEISGAPVDPRNSARNFVLCPGGEFDRSPCGTGTSAVLAARAAAGRLREGDVWRQEGILGGVFEATFERQVGRRILPTIAGRAFVTGTAELLFDERDPFAEGIPPAPERSPGPSGRRPGNRTRGRAT